MSLDQQQRALDQSAIALENERRRLVQEQELAKQQTVRTGVIGDVNKTEGLIESAFNRYAASGQTINPETLRLQRQLDTQKGILSAVTKDQENVLNVTPDVGKFGADKEFVGSQYTELVNWAEGLRKQMNAPLEADARKVEAARAKQAEEAAKAEQLAGVASTIGSTVGGGASSSSGLSDFYKGVIQMKNTKGALGRELGGNSVTTRQQSNKPTA